MGKAQGYEGNGSASGLWLIPTVKIAWGGVDQSWRHVEYVFPTDPIGQTTTAPHKRNANASHVRQCTIANPVIVLHPPL